jgi:hypothetical protein
MKSKVVVKFAADAVQVPLDFADVLIGGETITAGAIIVDPTGSLTCTAVSLASPLINLLVSAGTNLQSYGVAVTVNTTGGHVYTKTLSVVVNDNLAYEYQNKNVDAFNDLVGQLEAGGAAIGTCSFMFPLGFDTDNGVVRWELLDRDGVVYSSGSAYDYDSEVLSANVKVTSSAVINTPSDMVPTLEGQNYQVRWTLVIDGQSYYSFENLVITGPNTVPEGVEDVVELVFNDIPVSCVFQDPFDFITFEVYSGNDLVIPATNVPNQVKVPDGYLSAGVITAPLSMPAALEAYTIIWSGWNSENAALKSRQTGRIFIVNPSVMAAVDDMRVLINKAATTIAHRSDLIFSTPLLLAYLRRGRDGFNGAQGIFTGFTMLNATAGLREFWLRYSEVLALRAQFLAEGEKVFNFSGQAISLDVDRTGFYQSMADSIQSGIDNEVKPFKQNLIIKGHISGDGNLGPSGGAAQMRGAAGAVGITLSPATSWGKFGARWGIR